MRRQRRRARTLVSAVPIAAIAVWGLLALPGADRADGFPGTAGRVTIKGMEFGPRVVHIRAGEIVRWVNADLANHQVSTGTVDGRRPQPDGLVSSPLLFRGDEFVAPFRDAGVYPYYCSVHPFMSGLVPVTQHEAP